MSPRMRRVGKVMGYIAFGLVSFIFFLYLTFPYERVKNLIEDAAGASGAMTLTIGELSARPLLGLEATNVTVRLRPPKRASGAPQAAADKKARPQRISFAEVSVSLGLLPLLGGGIDATLHAEGLGGTLDGSYRTTEQKGFEISLNAEGINLRRLPLVAQAVGLPVAGQLRADVRLDVPKGQLASASGKVDLRCTACTVGDGKAKLKLKGNPFLAMGVTLPRVRLGRLDASLRLSKGKVTFKNVRARSPDIEVKLEGGMQLARPLPLSSIDAYLTFKLSEELKQRDPRLSVIEQGLGSGRRPDGSIGVRLSGALRTLRPIPTAIGLSGESG